MSQENQAPQPVAGGYKQAIGSKNCMQSAVAYMLGLPMEAVPDFEKAGPDAWESFYAFIAERGFTAEMFPPNVEIDGDYLASGATERGTSHMVVMRGGKLLHDPHPSNAGLTSPQVVWVIARKAGPSPAVKAGETLQTSLTQQADAHLRALLRYTENFYGTAIEHGMKAGPTANAIAHVERAGKALHQIIHAQATMLAASKPPVQHTATQQGEN